MSRTVTTRNALAQAYADLGHEISLHDGDPGETGDNDIGLTHQVLTWGSPDEGTVISDSVEFAVPQDTVLTHVGLWDDSGNFLDSFVDNLTFTADTPYGVSIRYTQE